ncbi:MAG: hypothetical protein LBC68_10920 [Prevotellaceae bacterium]|jgi:hypothetical protein|nr:hypothetical protein [Prevotellaceae bacterium]
MYKVLVKINASEPENPKIHYRAVIYKGIFMPKPGSKITEHEIREQVREEVSRLINKPTWNLRISVMLDKLPMDFIIKEKENNANRNQE